MEGMTLPIEAFETEIINSVKENNATIIVAETGAGKSTQVPQMLLRAGYTLIVTQPRRLAARTVAARVAEEFGEYLGETIGYRTRHEREESSQTRCLFCTDGLAMVRELLGANSNAILVVDEVHEWNENIEVLVAWAKMHKVKTVLMSATIKAEELSKYFDDAPVIDVPGRLHPIVEEDPLSSIEASAASLLQRGRNVLVFVPGKADIERVTIAVTQLLGDSPGIVFPLHGEMTPGDQALAFDEYDVPKCVVATNVAQTSITIPDIDAVVDSGMERRKEVRNGVEGLFIRPISVADSKQRRGRAGRTRPGIYVNHVEQEQELYPVPEIQRTLLDKTYLRLACAGFKMEELDFFHQPPREEIQTAKDALEMNGCIVDGTPTGVGRRANKMPVGVSTALMIMSAMKNDCLSEALLIAALIENRGGIGGRGFNPMLYTSERQSDLLAQADAFLHFRKAKNEELKAANVHVKSFHLVKSAWRQLCKEFRVFPVQVLSNRDALRRAIYNGHRHRIATASWGGFSVVGSQRYREQCRESVVGSAQVAVVEPWDLEIKTRRGPMTLYLVRNVTVIPKEWITDHPRYTKRETVLEDRVLVNHYFNNIDLWQEEHASVAAH